MIDLKTELLTRRTSLFKYVLAGIMLLALIVVVGAAGGCADQIGEAEAVIDKANKNTDEMNALEEEIVKIDQQIEDTPDTEAGAKKALDLSRDYKEKAEEQKDEAEENVRLFQRGKSLDLPDEYKQYFKLETKASRANLDSVETEIRLAEKSEEVFGQIAAGSVDENELSALEELDRQLEEEDQEYDDLKNKADAYFREHQLGS